MPAQRTATRHPDGGVSVGTDGHVSEHRIKSGTNCHLRAPGAEGMLGTGVRATSKKEVYAQILSPYFF